MKNHLMIGLGGTGLAVLHAVRRCLVQEGRAGGSPRANLRFSANDGSTRFAANQSQQYASETTSSHKMVRELACNVPTRVRGKPPSIFTAVWQGEPGVACSSILRSRSSDFALSNMVSCARPTMAVRGTPSRSLQRYPRMQRFRKWRRCGVPEYTADQDKAVRLRYRQPGAVHRAT